MRKIKRNEIYNSENFNDLELAYNEGYKGFKLICDFSVSQIYIDNIINDPELISLVNGNMSHIGNGLVIKFDGEEEKKEPINISNSWKYIIAFMMCAVLAFWIIVAAQIKPETPEIIEPKTSVVVQDFIIPVDCFITYSKLEKGYSLYIKDINSDFQVYIEVEDYKSFINEYLTKSKL